MNNKALINEINVSWFLLNTVIFSNDDVWVLALLAITADVNKADVLLLIPKTAAET